MGDIRDAWNDFVFVVRRRVLSEFLRVTFQRGERIHTRIQAWYKPDQWVPFDKYAQALKEAAEARNNASQLSAALAKVSVRGNLDAMANDASLDQMRHRAMESGYRAGYERALREAGAIKQWKEAEKALDLIHRFQNEAGRAAYTVGDDHFAELEDTVSAIRSYLWSVINTDGSFS